MDYSRAGDPGRALEAFDRSLGGDSTFAPAWAMRGWTSEHLGERRTAINDLETATRLDPSLSVAFLRLGVLYQKEERHAEAERCYLRVIELDPSDIEALNNLADVCMRDGRTEEARWYLVRALGENPDYPNALYGLGYYYELNGEMDRAEELYQRALPYSPARARLLLMDSRLSAQR